MKYTYTRKNPLGMEDGAVSTPGALSRIDFKNFTTLKATKRKARKGKRK